MNISKKLLILFLPIINYQLQAHYTEPVSLIYEIPTSDELHGALESKKPCIIKLHAPNCPYCTMFSKTFEKSAKNNRKITFLSANGKNLNAPQIISNYTNGTIKIPGYPSILFIKNSKVVDYQIGGNDKIFQEKLENLLK
ncbi:thioredoxin family protein [Candidatus Dependentiae bacterium]|nr:thioredoxin family protein [Candidatus Dependentiae bacterium]